MEKTNPVEKKPLEKKGSQGFIDPETEKKGKNLIDVTAKYGLKGGQLSQDKIDNLVDKYKKKSEMFEKKSKKLSAENVALQELNKIKSEFAAMATHELKVPIKNIIASVEDTLKNHINEISPEVKEQENIILMNAKRVMEQIQQILDFSRAEASKEGFILELVEFRELIDSIIKYGMKPLAEAQHIDLKSEINEGLPKVKANKEKITQVINNFIENAIKYAGKGALITVSAKVKGNDIIVSVTDTGPGIPKEEIPKLFEKFHRVAGSEKKAEGTGLGLAICKQVIEKHKGKIWAESTLGKGSTFSFSLPLKRIESGQKNNEKTIISKSPVTKSSTTKETSVNSTSNKLNNIKDNTKSLNNSAIKKPVKKPVEPLKK